MEDDDEDLAHELLLGTLGSNPREYPERGSKRELAARAALARLLRKGDSFYIWRVADMIDPSLGSAVAEREVFFKRRDKGTPVVVGERRRAEIAAFLQEGLKEEKKIKPKGKPNFKAVVAAAENEFGVGRSTILAIWSDYKPIKPNRNGPTK
jgi:hypothetical protein